MKQVYVYASIISAVLALACGAFGFIAAFAETSQVATYVNDIVGMFGISVLWGFAFAIGGFVISVPISLLISALILPVVRVVRK